MKSLILILGLIIIKANAFGFENQQKSLKKDFAVSELEELNSLSSNLWAEILNCNANNFQSAISRYQDGTICSENFESHNVIEVKNRIRALKGNILSYLLSANNPLVGMGLNDEIIYPSPLLSQILIENIIGIRSITVEAVSNTLGRHREIGTIKIDATLLQCSTNSEHTICQKISADYPAERAKFALEIARSVLRSTSNICNRLGFFPNQALYSLLEYNHIFGTHISFHSPVQKEDLHNASCINAEFKESILPKNFLGDFTKQTEWKNFFSKLLKN